MTIRRKRFFNIAMSRCKVKGKSEMALLSNMWSDQAANGFRGPYTCLPHEYVRQLYAGWLKLCYLQLALGIILFIGNVINSSRMTKNDDPYLFFQRTYHETTHLIVYGGSITLIISAVTGVILAYRGFPSAHIRNVQAAINICFICTIGSIWFSIAIENWPEKRSYMRNFEVEAHHRGDIRFHIMWKGKHEVDNIWDNMQKDLRCCGYRGYMDWVNSPCQCIPVSCCSKSNKAHFKECSTLLSGPNKQLKFPEDAAKINYIADHLLWRSSCLNKLEKKFINEKKFWIYFPTGCVCIQFVLLTLHAWLSGKILYYITSVPGARIQMDLFKGRFHLLKNYKTLRKGLKEIDDPYQIILHDHPFTNKKFIEKNSKTFIVLNTSNEFTSIEIVDHSIQDLELQSPQGSAKSATPSFASRYDSLVQTSGYLWTDGQQ